MMKLLYLPLRTFCKQPCHTIPHKIRRVAGNVIVPSMSTGIILVLFIIHYCGDCAEEIQQPRQKQQCEDTGDAQIPDPDAPPALADGPVLFSSVVIGAFCLAHAPPR